jgi:hypothetical protein
MSGSPPVVLPAGGCGAGAPGGGGPAGDAPGRGEPEVRPEPGTLPGTARGTDGRGPGLPRYSVAWSGPVPGAATYPSSSRAPTSADFGRARSGFSDPWANGSVLAGRDDASRGSRPGGSAAGVSSSGGGPGGSPRRASPGGSAGGPGGSAAGVPAEGPDLAAVSGWLPKAAATSAAPVAAASGAASRSRMARSNASRCGSDPEPVDTCHPRTAITRTVQPYCGNGHDAAHPWTTGHSGRSRRFPAIRSRPPPPSAPSPGPRSPRTCRS